MSRKRLWEAGNKPWEGVWEVLGRVWGQLGGWLGGLGLGLSWGQLGGRGLGLRGKAFLDVGLWFPGCVPFLFLRFAQQLKL